MRHGDVVATRGGDLPCQYVYHGAMKDWDGRGKEAEKVCKNMFYQVKYFNFRYLTMCILNIK